VTTRTAAKPRPPRPPGDPVWRAVTSVHDRLSAVEAALAPAFAVPKAAPKESTVTEPLFATARSSSGMDWGKFPDHDPDFLAGRITLDQARLRHQHPDSGCGCGNCVRDRQLAEQQHQPEPIPEAKCPFCVGGYVGVPEGMGWASCTACNAAEFERLQREAYQGNQYTAASVPLLAARQRVIDCTECSGTGKVWSPPPPGLCPACKGSGRDDHIVTPRGTLWRSARFGLVRASAPGQQQQTTHWEVLAEAPPPEPGLPEAVMPRPAPIAAEANADQLPDFMAARALGARVTQPRGF
jgi:hypothetical protein